MNLWTPSRTIESPRCPRCGGLNRAYLRANRRRMGMAHHVLCCCDQCYSLTHCVTSAVTYTRTDLSAYVGLVVLISGACYTVAENVTCTSPADVTVTSDWASCGRCLCEGTCESGTSCGWCACTPDCMRLVVSDVVLCSCMNQTSGGDLSWSWIVNINGSHDLSQTVACTWAKTITGAIRETTWASTNGSCSGGSTFEDVDVELSVGKINNTTAALSIEALLMGFIFQDTITVAAGNCESWSFSNDNTSGNCKDVGDNVAYGGSATVTACCP